MPNRERVLFASAHNNALCSASSDTQSRLSRRHIHIFLGVKSNSRRVNARTFYYVRDTCVACIAWPLRRDLLFTSSVSAILYSRCRLLAFLSPRALFLCSLIMVRQVSAPDEISRPCSTRRLIDVILYAPPLRGGGSINLAINAEQR